MDIKTLLESLNKLNEEAELLGEETLIDTPAEETEHDAVVETPKEIKKVEFTDTMTLADTLDAKAKIAKALENLKDSVEEFKNATAEKVDIMKDAALIQQIEGLDVTIEGIEAILAEGILMKSELNDPFRAELPTEAEEQQEEKPQEQGEEDLEHEEKEEPEQDLEFEDVAGLNMLGEN